MTGVIASESHLMVDYLNSLGTRQDIYIGWFFPVNLPESMFGASRSLLEKHYSRHFLQAGYLLN